VTLTPSSPAPANRNLGFHPKSPNHTNRKRKQRSTTMPPRRYTTPVGAAIIGTNPEVSAKLSLGSCPLRKKARKTEHQRAPMPTKLSKLCRKPPTFTAEHHEAAPRAAHHTAKNAATHLQRPKMSSPSSRGRHPSIPSKHAQTSQRRHQPAPPQPATTGACLPTAPRHHRC
jgi:hypothetical protein